MDSHGLEEERRQKEDKWHRQTRGCRPPGDGCRKNDDEDKEEQANKEDEEVQDPDEDEEGKASDERDEVDDNDDIKDRSIHRRSKEPESIGADTDNKSVTKIDIAALEVQKSESTFNKNAIVHEHIPVSLSGFTGFESPHLEGRSSQIGSIQEQQKLEAIPKMGDARARREDEYANDDKPEEARRAEADRRRTQEELQDMSRERREEEEEESEEEAYQSKLPKTARRYEKLFCQAHVRRRDDPFDGDLEPPLQCSKCKYHLRILNPDYPSSSNTVRCDRCGPVQSTGTPYHRSTGQQTQRRQAMEESAGQRKRGSCCLVM